MKLHRATLPLIFLLLGACNGDAPLLTCPAACSDANEYRDLFCTCQKKPNHGPPPPPPAPQYNAVWSYRTEDTGLCNSNPHYFVKNVSKHTIRARVETCLPAGSTSCRKTSYWTDAIKPGPAPFPILFVEYGEEEPDCKDRAPRLLAVEVIGRSNTDSATKYKGAASGFGDYFALRESLFSLGGSEPASEFGDTRAMQKFLSKPRVARTDIDVAYLQSTGLTGATRQSRRALNCATECAEGTGPNCIALQSFDGGQIAEAYAAISSLKPGSTVPISIVNAAFNLNGDICAREDVVTTPMGRVHEKGKHCTYPLRADAQSAPFMSFTVPDYISGDTPVTGGEKSITFPSPFEAPWATWKRWSLDNKLGGPVNHVEASDGKLRYQIGGGCLEVPLTSARPSR